MKIAIEANVLTIPATGIAKSLIYLINNVHLLRPDWQFVLFANNDILYELDFTTQKIKYSDNILSKIYLKHKLHDCDFIHYHWNGGVIPILQKHKNIVMIHDVLPLEIPNFFITEQEKNEYIKQIQLSLNKSAVVFTPSAYSKKKIQEKFIVKSPIKVLKHGITINQPTKIQKSDYYIYVGGYSSRKSLPELLQEFINMHPKRKLYFVGEIGYFSAEFERLVKQAENIGVLKQCGYVAETELSNLIASAKGLIYPSKWEGFGMPPLEAMNIGTPAFVTRGTCIPEICGTAAIYFNPDTTGDLTNQINKFENGEYPNIISAGLKHSQNIIGQKQRKNI